MMNHKWLMNLQLFGGEGAAGDGGAGAADSGVGAEGAAPAAEETRLRELGVPEAVLSKRAKRQKSKAKTPGVINQMSEPVTMQSNAPAAEEAIPTDAEEQTESQQPTQTEGRLSWEDLMNDPEYKAAHDKAVQDIVRLRLSEDKSAKKTLDQLAPALQKMAEHYGLDAKNINYEELGNAITNDDAYYSDLALKMGVSTQTAKDIDQQRREAARQKEEAAQAQQDANLMMHYTHLQQQAEQMKTLYPNFDLDAELKNPVFLRLTAPGVNVPMETAYKITHEKELDAAKSGIIAQNMRKEMSNAIQSNSRRPVENGTSGAAPSTSTFDYSKASPAQRKAFKEHIMSQHAKGIKVYPGTYKG